MGPLTLGVFLSPLLWLLLVYGILRLAYLSARRDLPALVVARHHAMWAALLALVASGFFGESHLRSLSARWGAADTTRITEQALGHDLLEAGRPVAMMAAIYVIAQFTGPPQRSNVRVAELAVRRLRDYLPTRLTVFVGALVLAGMVAISATAALPGITPQREQEGPPPFDAVARVPGMHFAAVAGGAHLILVIGVLAALVVIVRRPREPILTQPEDDVMRRVFINRILRLTALLCAGTLVSCVEFASTGSSEHLWDVLGICATVLFFITLVVVLAARPRFSSEELDEQLGHHPTDPGGPLPHTENPRSRAGYLVLSGRRIGYLMWSIGVIALLLVMLPLGGLPALAVLSLAYLVFLGMQLFTDMLLTRNLGKAGGPRGLAPQHLPSSLVIPLVPTVLAVVGTAALALWLFSVPGRSPELPFSLIAFCLVLGASALALNHAATRPSLRDTPVQEDDHLRGATIRRVLLVAQSGMVALSSFLISDNRSALARLLNPGATDVDAYPSDEGTVEGIALALLVTAIVIAVLPAKLRRDAAAPLAGIKAAS